MGKLTVLHEESGFEREVYISDRLAKKLLDGVLELKPHTSEVIPWVSAGNKPKDNK